MLAAKGLSFFFFNVDSGSRAIYIFSFGKKYTFLQLFINLVFVSVYCKFMLLFSI